MAAQQLTQVKMEVTLMFPGLAVYHVHLLCIRVHACYTLAVDMRESVVAALYDC